MKVVVKSASERDIRIPLPSFLFWNSMTALIAAGFLRKKQIPVTAGQLRKLFREVRLYKRSHPQWTLVEVQEADGGQVTVKL